MSPIDKACARVNEPIQTLSITVTIPVSAIAAADTHKAS
ncbi:hypothetical protein DFP97_108260 [Paenibacillus prosopidis]|uniref:Uncharacterized protein n=1 Tax=Paenibacillus prosopidis TaxID=630520 RepID=A0A368W1S9_9BACL|nr:hypothetical protein DFP97_108260 [Paenibacillus prosopidis]